MAQARIAFGIFDSQRFLLGDSSLFSPVGVYSPYLFVRNYIFPRWGFTIILLSWGITSVLSSLYGVIMGCAINAHGHGIFLMVLMLMSYYFKLVTLGIEVFIVRR